MKKVFYDMVQSNELGPNVFCHKRLYKSYFVMLLEKKT